MALYGYEVGRKFNWAHVNPRHTSKLVKVRSLTLTGTRPNYVNNGFQLVGFAPLTPNIRSLANVVGGFYKRPAMSHTYSPSVRDEYAWFVMNVYIPEFVNVYKRDYVLEDDRVVIKRLDLSSKKIEMMLKLLDSMRDDAYQLDKRGRIIELHVKREFYVAKKLARLIMPLPMRSRVAYCAVISALNKTIYGFPSCVKNMDFDSRVARIRSLFHTDTLSNDNSSFESSQDLWVLNNIIEPIYLALCDGKDDGRLQAYINYRKQKLIMRYDGLQFETEPILNSGGLDTSLSNFLFNDSSVRFAAWKAGMGVDINMLAEGDDLVCEVIPNLERVLRDIGITTKLEYHDNPNDVSFCRCYPGGNNNLTDAVYALAKLGWSDAKYLGANDNKKLGLLKAKCMSYLVQFGGCPIIGPVCKEIYLKLHEVETVIDDDWWEKEKMKFWSENGANKVTTLKDRSEYMRLFNVEIDTQLTIERELIQSIQKHGFFQPISSGELHAIVQRDYPDWIKNFDKRCHLVNSIGKIEKMHYISDWPTNDNVWTSEIESIY